MKMLSETAHAGEIVSTVEPGFTSQLRTPEKTFENVESVPVIDMSVLRRKELVKMPSHHESF